MRVAVCIITFRREKGLRRLLNELNKITFSEIQPQLEIIVVDNDCAGLARRICDEFRKDYRWKLTDYVEKMRGIPQARNKAIECAKGNVDFIAFIDDDEVPMMKWLEELLIAQERYGADVVTGPVVPEYCGENVPDWIRRGGFFKSERKETGTLCNIAYTHNILFRSEIFNRYAKAFDLRFALTGGEDTYFSMMLSKEGYNIVWADKALVREFIPESRMKPLWILKRAFRYGTTNVVIRRDCVSRGVWASWMMAECVGKSILGIVTLPLGIFYGKYKFIKSARHFCYAAGVLAGLCGFEYDEYKKTHGA